MIRINLAKVPGKKGAPGGKSGGAGGAFWVVFLLLIAGGGYYYFDYVEVDDEGVSTFSKWVASASGAFLLPGPDEPHAPAVARSAQDVFDGEPLLGDTVDKPRVDGVDKIDKVDKVDKVDKAEPPQVAVVEAVKPAVDPKIPVVDAKKPAVEPPKTVAAQEPDRAIAALVSTPPAPSGPPSSMVRTKMAENVVGELKNNVRPVGSMNTKYEEMGVVEKINYEVLFGRNAFDLVTRSAPPGVMLRSLEIENFQTIYASGGGAAREMVQEMFVTFKSARGELLPRPYSHIKDDGRGGYNFVITFKPHFGSDFSDPFQAFDHIGFRGGIAGHLKTFTRTAGANGVKITAAPRQTSAVNTGNYRRVTYSVAGTAAYKDFHKFVAALYEARVPCAFKTIKMTPVKDEVVRVNAEILFTVKQ